MKAPKVYIFFVLLGQEKKERPFFFWGGGEKPYGPLSGDCQIRAGALIPHVCRRRMSIIKSVSKRAREGRQLSICREFTWCTRLGKKKPGSLYSRNFKQCLAEAAEHVWVKQMSF